MTITPGLVSVVLVNYKGVEDTLACLAAFDGLDWPRERLEVVVVDNASGDGSAARLRAEAPWVTVVESATNSGFAGGCNLGVANAHGEYVAFLNNDARADKGWVRAAVDVLAADAGIGAVASKVLDWEGEKVDYVDGSLTWYGMGYKREAERPDSAEYDVAKDVLFGTGAAMFVRTALFREIGGFDERFFMFFEDVDLGWRLNLLGHRVRYVPGSLAFHKHHASMNKFGQWREFFLLERNAMMMLYKNFGEETLAKVLPAALALAVRRGVERGGDDVHALDLEHGAGNEDQDTATVSKMTLVPSYAIDSFVSYLPSLAEDRAVLQSARVRSDKDLLPLFREPFEPAYPLPRYLEAHEVLVDLFGLKDTLSSRRRILIATGDTLSARMAGPAIRAWEIATALSAEHDVHLVTMNKCTATSTKFATSSVKDRELRRLEEWCDIIIFQGHVMSVHPWLADSTKIMVVDIYDPYHLEQLEQAKDHPELERRAMIRSTVISLNEQLTRGDFFMCASHKQRDFWLGQLAAVGRINPENYDHDESLDSLLAVVPFGVADAAPVKTARAIKGVVPGIGVDDKVIIWAGGIYNWFDPLTLIRAVDVVRRTEPGVRLFFLGLKHPNPEVAEMRMALQARELSDELGMTGSHVFFNEGWVPYDERQNYLMEAEIGVSTHLPHVETAFSFRTRILDYIWASLPIVATDGDTFAPIIRDLELGITVPPEDVDALADALLRVLQDDAFAEQCRANLRAMAPAQAWSEVLQPLIEFCRAPSTAPDRIEGLNQAVGAGPHPIARPGKPSSVTQDLSLFKEYFTDGGMSEVARRARGRISRRKREVLGR